MKRFELMIIGLFLLSCGGDGPGGPGERDDRGGPDSLVGYKWTSDPLTVNGIKFVFGFGFSRSSVTAKNTCNDAVTATIEVPVRYRYTANVPTGGRTDEEEGGKTCFAEIAAGTFDFEITDNKLVMTHQDKTFDFKPVGSVAGLYGNWTAKAPGVGTLTWSMGGGKIVATSDCDNGVSATVEVSADFVNKIEFTEAAKDVKRGDSGLECSMEVAAGVSTYRFDGDTLVMKMNGEEIRFSP
jgi:hypothetical protein